MLSCLDSILCKGIADLLSTDCMLTVLKRVGVTCVCSCNYVDNVQRVECVTRLWILAEKRVENVTDSKKEGGLQGHTTNSLQEHRKFLRIAACGRRVSLQAAARTWVGHVRALKISRNDSERCQAEANCYFLSNFLANRRPVSVSRS